MKTFNWLLKSIVLPLTPFLLGAMIRTVHSGELRREFFSASELSFSMAMLSLVLAVNASKLTNQTLRESLMHSCQLGVILALAIFGSVIFLEADIQESLRTVWVDAKSASVSHAAITIRPNKIDDFENMLARLQIVSFALAGLTVLFAVAANKRYGLEDL